MIDLGYGALERLLPSNPAELNELRQRLSPPAPNAPVMLPAHVDAWVQTSPAPAPDPDVSLFLHGPHRGPPEVQVCWRADLSPEDMSDEELSVSIVSLCPLSSPECIPVPIHNFRKWLERGESAPDFNDSDLEGVPAPAQDSPSGAVRGNRSALCWRGAEGSYLITGSETLDRLRPGDTVVIPKQLKGWEVFGHIPPGTGENPVVDLETGRTSNPGPNPSCVSATKWWNRGRRAHPAPASWKWPANPRIPRMRKRIDFG